MPHNVLITGSPGSGKTTVIERTISQLEEHGLIAGGIYCPEVRRDGERVGFHIVDLLTGESAMLAHVDRDFGPVVGKYRVDVENVDRVCRQAFSGAKAQADVLVVDEIAPMEIHSDVFAEHVRRALDGSMPVVAVIHERSSRGLIGEVKRRDDAELFEVTDETRTELPSALATFVREALEG